MDDKEILKNITPDVINPKWLMNILYNVVIPVESRIPK